MGLRPLKHINMKELIELYKNDIKDFSRKEKVIYGIIVPLVMFAMALLAELIESA